VRQAIAILALTPLHLNDLRKSRRPEDSPLPPDCPQGEISQQILFQKQSQTITFD